jgi:hypothetical protein
VEPTQRLCQQGRGRCINSAPQGRSWATNAFWISVLSIVYNFKFSDKDSRS